MVNIEKLFRLKELLEKNQTIKKVYSIEDHKKDFLNQIEVFSTFNWRDYQEIFNALKENLLFLKDYTTRDNSSSKNVNLINELIFDITNEIDDADDAGIFYGRSEDRTLLIALQNMVVIYAVTSIEEMDISRFLSIDGSDDMVFNYIDTNAYYRGESSFSYKLLPSIFRNYNVDRYGNRFNINVLFDLYKDANLLSKYGIIFDYRYINYDFCAYMQHSKSYSPLLDLTSEAIVALSFATKAYGDLNSYMNTDASLYEFKFKIFKRLDINNEMIFGNINSFIVSGRLRVSSTIRNEILCKCRYSAFSIDVSVFNEKVNDRMKYQKGSFLYINNSVIVNGIMLMPISMGRIVKYKISPTMKTKIYNAIKKYHSHYDYEHLMDPYMFFNDSPNV